MKENVRFQHRCVADLAWAVSSPPILNDQGGDCTWFDGLWYRERYRAIEHRLLQLDRDPVRLQQLLQAQKDQRLGNYFETLWAFALELDPRYQLVERNLQIIDGERTLGEMDFIVLDRDTGRYAHWELAIKFYLGVGDTSRHQAWYGPGKKDRLDLKVGHLRDRQTLLSTHPLVRTRLDQRGIVISDCAVILKGRLFYPWQRRAPRYQPQAANPSHLAGCWLTRDQFIQDSDPDQRYMPLIRRGWMSEYPTNDRAESVSAIDLISQLDKGYCRLPLHVSMLGAPSGQERLFIVDNNWPITKT
jgi:hypothetical protein